MLFAQVTQGKVVLPPLFVLPVMNWLQKKTIEDISYVHQSYVDGYKDALDEILAIAIELEAQ